MMVDDEAAKQDAEKPAEEAPADPSVIDPKQAKVDVQWKYESPLISCRFDPTGRFVFAAAEDFAIVRWDLAQGQPLAMKGHQSWPRGMVFSPDGQTLVTSGYDDCLIWWPVEAEKPEPLNKVAAHKGWIRCLAISPDGKLLASGGNDKTVKLWNMSDGTEVAQLAGHERDVYSCCFHPDGTQLLTGDLMGKIHQWNLADHSLVRTFDASSLHSYNGGQQVDYGGVRSLAFSPDQSRLIAAGLHKASNPLGAVNDPIVLQFNWESAELLRSHVADLRGIGWRALWHNAGFIVAASGGSGGGFLLFWKPEEDNPFHQLQLPNTAREMDLHPDGRQIATAHHDRHLRITRM